MSITRWVFISTLTLALYCVFVQAGYPDLSNVSSSTYTGSAPQITIPGDILPDYEYKNISGESASFPISEYIPAGNDAGSGAFLLGAAQTEDQFYYSFTPQRDIYSFGTLDTINDNGESTPYMGLSEVLISRVDTTQNASVEIFLNDPTGATTRDSFLLQYSSGTKAWTLVQKTLTASNQQSQTTPFNVVFSEPPTVGGPIRFVSTWMTGFSNNKYYQIFINGLKQTWAPTSIRAPSHLWMTLTNAVLLNTRFFNVQGPSDLPDYEDPFFQYLELPALSPVPVPPKAAKTINTIALTPSVPSTTIRLSEYFSIGSKSKPSTATTVVKFEKCAEMAAIFLIKTGAAGSQVEIDCAKTSWVSADFDNLTIALRTAAASSNEFVITVASGDSITTSSPLSLSFKIVASNAKKVIINAGLFTSLPLTWITTALGLSPDVKTLFVSQVLSDSTQLVTSTFSQTAVDAEVDWGLQNVGIPSLSATAPIGGKPIQTVTLSFKLQYVSGASTALTIIINYQYLLVSDTKLTIYYDSVFKGALIKYFPTYSTVEVEIKSTNLQGVEVHESDYTVPTIDPSALLALAPEVRVKQEPTIGSIEIVVAAQVAIYKVGPLRQKSTMALYLAAGNTRLSPDFDVTLYPSYVLQLGERQKQVTPQPLKTKHIGFLNPSYTFSIQVTGSCFIGALPSGPFPREPVAGYALGLTEEETFQQLLADCVPFTKDDQFSLEDITFILENLYSSTPKLTSFDVTIFEHADDGSAARTVSPLLINNIGSDTPVDPIDPTSPSSATSVSSLVATAITVVVIAVLF